MTDNDIIKALEMCTSCGCIESCPMFFNGTDSTSNCRYALLGKALTLINRQKAEIEELKEDNKQFANHLVARGDFIEKVRTEAIKEFWNQRPPHLHVTQKWENLYNDGWNDCLAFFAEEYRIFLGIDKRKKNDNDPAKEMVGERE